jgi:AraC-like DNA-binding protein
MSPKFERIDAYDLDEAPLLFPIGWDKKYYRLGCKDFHFSKRSLDLTPQLNIQENILYAGRVRLDGAIEPGRLQIAFVESEELRLIGASIDNCIMTVAYDNACWEAVANMKGRGLTINISADLASKSFSVEDLTALKQAMLGPHGKNAIISSMFPIAQTTKKATLECLDTFETYDLLGNHTNDNKFLPWDPTEIMELCVNIIEEVVKKDFIQATLGEMQRHQIARAVEEYLWNDPSKLLHKDFSLDFFANQLGASRRTIQMAVKEVFGIGFVELKRLIRLQQIRYSLLLKQDHSSVLTLAQSYAVGHFGRFAKDYRDLFGELPSQTNKRLQNSQP